ncbi:MAG: hypothetical protein ABMB14_28050 [Myxococcota bacterium]
MNTNPLVPQEDDGSVAYDPPAVSLGLLLTTLATTLAMLVAGLVLA